MAWRIRLRNSDAAPDTIQIHGDDGDVTALDDALHAALKRRHQPGTAELPFGKDADQFAIKHGLPTRVIPIAQQDAAASPAAPKTEAPAKTAETEPVPKET